MHLTRSRAAVLSAVSAVLLAIAIIDAPAQGNFDDVVIKTHHVAGNVHMLEGSGGNIGVSAGEDGILIVDDQFKPLAGKIRAALQGIKKGDLRFVLNTHFHGDHVGGNEVFGRDATIVAHDNVRRRLSTRTESSRGTREPAPKEAWPVITFDHSVSIHFNGERIEVLHVPSGHTDGDSIIFFTGSNVVHMGDQMFSGLFPFVDTEGGGSLKGYTDNVAAVIARVPDDVKVIPGHGPISTIKELKEFHGMLIETAAIVEKKIKAGATLDTIKAEGLPGWESWSWQFISTERWIESLHASLTLSAAAGK